MTLLHVSFKITFRAVVSTHKNFRLSASVSRYCLLKNKNSLLNIHLPKMNANGSKLAIDDAKRKAAQQCVQENVKSGQVVGIGTGSTTLFAIEYLGEKYESGKIKNIICVPTSVDSKILLMKSRLPISDLDQHCDIDVYIDGADEVDQNLDCIKGAGGCLTEEKIVMSCSKKFFVIVDYRKRSLFLGENWKSVPIEVCRTAHVPVGRRIEEQEGGTCKLRVAVGKAGPLVTDHGNYILDWFFPATQQKTINGRWDQINTRLKLIPGVVETGLFLNCANKAYFGLENGYVAVSEAPNKRLNGFLNGTDEN